MATPPKKQFSLSSRILWWVSFGIMLAGCVLAVFELQKRQHEITEMAFEDARRLTIDLSDGAIEARPPAIGVPPEEKHDPTHDVAPETQNAPEAPTVMEDSDTQSYVAPEAKSQEAPVPMPDHLVAPAEPSEPAEPASAPTPEQPASPESPATPLEPTGKTLPLPGDEADQKRDVAPLPVLSSSPMADAPAMALTEQSPAGPLPKIASDGTKPWQYYAKPYIPSGSKPQVAIIITELGLNKNVTELAASLPDTVTLSMSPYAPTPEAWSKSLRVRGHELMLDLPLEPIGYPTTDPGPDGLLVSSPADHNLERLQRVLGRYAGYVGVTIPDQERFTANRDAAYPVMSNINRRGLIFLLTAIPDKSVEELFKYNSFPYLACDLLIDLELKPDAIKQKLIQLEDLARRQGYAIGMARALPVSIKQIDEWAQTLAKSNIELVPLSSIAKTKYK